MTHRLPSSLLALSLGSVALLLGSTARADEEPPPRAHVPLPGSDGVYGRLDGSATISASLGAELEGEQARAALRLSACYQWTAGVYARYSEGFGKQLARPLRAASLGVELRPLFLPRFALDAERGPALLDLTLDSLALTAGAYFAQARAERFGEQRGFETGLGMGVPLLGRAEGPWLELRAERRFVDRGGGAWLFTLAFAYHVVTLSNEPQR